MSGGASFNSSFEVAPMREPIQKTKGNLWPLWISFDSLFFSWPPDSMLSAEAPEFVPRPQPINTSHHRNQQSANHNAYRNHGPAQNFPVRNKKIYILNRFIDGSA